MRGSIGRAAWLDVALTFVALSFGGCADQGLAEMRVLRDQVCACTSVPCVNEALGTLRDWRARDREKLDVLASEAMACAGKVMRAAAASAAEPPSP